MDANEYARTTQPAAKALGLLLNSALWLGKGKRPAAAVIEPMKAAAVEEMAPQQAMHEEQPTAVIEDEPEPAAKEENAISLPNLPTTTTENVLPLAAPSSPSEETRPATLLPGTDVPTEIRGEEIWLTLGERRYRVLGLEKNTSMGVLRVNMMVTAQNTRGEISLHVDMLDLYGARQRTAYAKAAGAELGIKEDGRNHRPRSAARAAQAGNTATGTAQKDAGTGRTENRDDGGRKGRCTRPAAQSAPARSRAPGL